MAVTIDLARCDGNGECVKACAFSAVEVRDGKAVIFDNCTDCGACVIACPTKALWSDLFSVAGRAGILAVDFSTSSGIASIVDRAARGAEASAVWMLADPTDAGKSADAIAVVVKEGGYSLVVLPHREAGPAIAARLAARLGANLLAGCGAIRIDDAGGVRAVRPRFGGIVKAPARCASGVTVATVYPRTIAVVAAAPISEVPPERTAAGEAPAEPPTLARRIVAIGPGIVPDADRAARAFAHALGATVVDISTLRGKSLSPDLFVSFGVPGSTEINAAFRNSRTVVTVVTDAAAPITQIADYILVGDLAEHAKALLAAL
jgi:electron transfer flavoprotein alpha subunit/NAD-dependent dihydropyrimidine dehydrogenase PreA subunit